MNGAQADVGVCAGGELAHFARGFAAGRLGMTREYARSLPAWFETHLATMDSAPAGFLKLG
jgi:hypothetical protein